MFRPFLRGHILQDPTGLLHECADVATHRLHHANPTGVDRGSMSGPALPFGFTMQLSVAELRDAALGLRDAWNHGVLLRTIDQFDPCTLRERGAMLRFRRGEHIVKIAEWITEFGLRAM